jgi:hypothetical protein
MPAQQAAPAGRKFTPVDNDPFATPAAPIPTTVIRPRGPGDYTHAQEGIPTPYDKPTQPEQGLGIVERANRATADTFEGPYGIQKGPALEGHPFANALFDATVKPVSKLIDAMGRPIAAAGSAVAGGAAGLAEDLGMSRTNADAFERDLRGLMQAGAIAGATSPQGSQKYAPPAIAPETIKPIHEFVKAITGDDISSNKAALTVVKRMEQDSRYGGPSAQSMIDLLNAAPSKPQSLIDVGGENVRGLGGRVYRAPGEGRAIIGGRLGQRDLGAGGRLAGDVNRALPAGSSYDTHATLDAARKAAARPAYEVAYAKPPINPDEMAPTGRIGSMMSRPVMKSGVANALKIAAEEGRDPLTLGIDLDEQGNVKFVQVPTWRTLDYIKRGVDNVLEQYRDRATGRMQLDTYGRAAEETRATFRGVLRDLNPEYGAALDSYSGPSTSMDALHAGEDFLKQRPEEIARRLADFGSGDREFYKLGAADTLRARIADVGVSGDEAKAIIRSQRVRDKLRPLFDNEQQYERFIASVEAEQRMFYSNYKVRGNSLTAEREAEDASSHDTEALIRGAHGAAAMASGRHLWGLRNVVEALRGWKARHTDPAVNAQIADILTSDLSGQMTSGRLRNLEETLRSLQKPPKRSGELPRNNPARTQVGLALYGATKGMPTIRIYPNAVPGVAAATTPDQKSAP